MTAAAFHRCVPAAAIAVLLASACAGSNAPAAPSTADTASGSAARYRVTFDATWSAATHPEDFPASAHFSRLVGGTHAAAVTFWASGAPASPGIRDMAERGRTSPLDEEIAASIARGAADQLILGGSIDVSPGSAVAEFDARREFPLLTLVSMIAPSPDWFVGIAGLALFADGRWIDEHRVPLEPWDAGTDSGATFLSADAVTAPPGSIAPILSAPLSPGGRVRPVGTFVITRIQ